jgi:hypothetical protein
LLILILVGYKYLKSYFVFELIEVQKMDSKNKLDSLLKGSKVCIKCGSEVPFDEVSGKCEIMNCPKCDSKKK